MVMEKSVEIAGAGLREDLLHHDPLLDCLVELTRIHARPSTRAALVAGLPLEKGSLTPSLFARAASRAGLAAKLVRRPLERIDDARLKAVTDHIRNWLFPKAASAAVEATPTNR